MKHLILAGLFLVTWNFAQAQEKAGPPNLYPDAILTPGDVVVVSTAIVCVTGYSKTVRNVPDSEKKEVFLRYKIPWTDHSKYEVDHFISLELGGNNNLANLWPQLYMPTPGAREKDVVENYLHWQVCHNGMTLIEAQDAIKSDWYKIYLMRMEKIGNKKHSK